LKQKKLEIIKIEIDAFHELYCFKQWVHYHKQVHLFPNKDLPQKHFTHLNSKSRKWHKDNLALKLFYATFKARFLSG